MGATWFVEERKKSRAKAVKLTTCKKIIVANEQKKSRESVTVRCDPAGKVLVTRDRKTIKWYNIPLHITKMSMSVL